jgi:hypothetical protein
LSSAPQIQRRIRKPFDWSTAAIGVVVAFAAGFVFVHDGREKFFEILKSDFSLFIDIQPKVLAACIIAALVAVLLPRETVSRWVGAESGFLGLVIGTLAGVILPGGPITIFPIASAFIAVGADVGDDPDGLPNFDNLGLLLHDDRLYMKALAIADDAQKLMKTVNSPNGTFAKIFTDDALYNDVRGTIGRLNGIIDGIERGEGTAGKLLKDTALYDDLRKTIADVRQMLGDVNAGKGTVGKLLKSDELHDQLKASMTRIDTILDKLNSGQGTLGQMLVNPALYETLDSTMREVHGLMKDFRANPKKFLRIKLGLF